MDPEPALRQLLAELMVANRHVPVLVEGKRDAKALRALGLTGTLVEIHHGQPIIEFTRQISRRYSAVILLTDWDQRGEQLFERLRQYLTCDIDESFRQRLKALAPQSLYQVEDLPGYLAGIGS
ncbi:MAG: hypothetical protein HY335_06720 [Deinococcus sp.]|nr:hypothetical protein [Deinococcus sp.]